MLIRNIVCVVVLSIILTGCNGLNNTLDLRKPAALNLNPPEGPPEYMQGWTDGCESGMDTYSTDLAKTFGFFDLKQDPKLRKNKMYYQVWKDAYLYCVLFLESGYGKI